MGPIKGRRHQRPGCAVERPGSAILRLARRHGFAKNLLSLRNFCCAANRRNVVQPSEGERGIWARVSALPASISIITPSPIFNGESGAGPLDFMVTAVVLAAGALALAGGLWALSEHRSTVSLRRALRAATAKARARVSARDAWLSATRESLLVWSAEPAERLSFGDAAKLMDACMAGPDAARLSASLEVLSAT